MHTTSTGPSVTRLVLRPAPTRFSDESRAKTGSHPELLPAKRPTSERGVPKAASRVGMRCIRPRPAPQCHIWHRKQPRPGSATRARAKTGSPIQSCFQPRGPHRKKRPKRGTQMGVKVQATCRVRSVPWLERVRRSGAPCTPVVCTHLHTGGAHRRLAPKRYRAPRGEHTPLAPSRFAHRRSETTASSTEAPRPDAASSAGGHARAKAQVRHRFLAPNDSPCAAERGIKYQNRKAFNTVSMMATAYDVSGWSSCSATIWFM